MKFLSILNMMIILLSFLQSGVNKDNTTLHFDANATGGVYKWTNTLPNFESQGVFLQVDSIQPSGVGIYDTTSIITMEFSLAYRFMSLRI